tara:strand:+ start:252 stop:551 length:300 start_codon:yes stop_codon:yes gene_type:complete
MRRLTTNTAILGVLYWAKLDDPYHIRLGLNFPMYQSSICYEYNKMLECHPVFYKDLKKVDNLQVGRILYKLKKKGLVERLNWSNPSDHNVWIFIKWDSK